MRGLRGRFAVAAAVTASLMALAGAAWACTVQSQIVALDPIVGPERSTVRVRGEGLAAAVSSVAGRPVEIRWNSAGGPVIGSSTVDGQGRFSADVTVPAASPGTYSLVAVAEGAGLGRAAFQVSSASSPADASRAMLAPALPGSTTWSSAALGSTPREASGAGLAVGLGFLGFGLTALMAGSAVVVRRRAAVSGGR